MAQIQLSTETIDDLIYSARAGDLAALKEDLGALSTQHSCSEGTVIASAIDSEPESEGGTGACLLHFPAANGNLEILNYLLQSLQNETKASVVNHRNHSGNTPLHWAALNTHLECVKALVEAGADISIKNDAGLDAVFLAERSAWSAEEDGEGEGSKGEGEAGAEGEEKGKMSPGRMVVEWLLSVGEEVEGNENANGDGDEKEEKGGDDAMDTGK
ncbi:ankyrin repeat protein [Aspergillus sclerotialis]|uniref:Ankyrin repeat protein n=1 Tax=Aspergillus sclerotialis TaxID=2070753 RepID=A0A3A2ZH25_9EURO|nr:ankyrin repeat protein [Aspergillus sclerotialis]